MRILSFLLLAGLTTALYAQDPLVAELRTGGEAYQRKDFAAFLASTEKAEAICPSCILSIVNRADALALNQRPAEAVTELRKLVSLKVGFDLSDHDLDSLRERDDFKALLQDLEKLHGTEVGHGAIAVTIRAKDLITEALAWDAKSQTFLVSAVRKRKIVRLDRKGNMSDFIPSGFHDLWAVNGLGIDTRRGIVYASSNAYGRSEGYDKSHEGESALYAFDLKGRFLHRYTPDGEKHAFDDLTVGADGTVYVSDARYIYRLKPGGEKLEELTTAGAVRGAQGSALSEDGRTLYVSSYAFGIQAVDLTTGKVTTVTAPADFPVYGIDGLKYFDHSLIGVQNGIEPPRVVRLYLQGGRIASWEILSMNNPLMDEPTIGVVVGSDYYVLIASQGNKFDVTPPKLEALHEAAIMKIPLGSKQPR